MVSFAGLRRAAEAAKGGGVSVVGGQAALEVFGNRKVDMGTQLFVEVGVELAETEERSEAASENPGPVHHCLLLCS
jgi:hypothetical protein